MMLDIFKKEIEVKEESKVEFGFWLYLMSDVLLFATLFATFSVLRNAVAGGVGGRDIFDLSGVLAETIILLTSSLTCAIALFFAREHRKVQTLFWFSITFLLGLLFIKLELKEFVLLVTAGHDWTQSAFLSSFFTLVATHGLHILVGLIWMIVLLASVVIDGLTPRNINRLQLLSLFWHFLDIIWIFIFTIVYLMSFI